MNVSRTRIMKNLQSIWLWGGFSSDNEDFDAVIVFLKDVINENTNGKQNYSDDADLDDEYDDNDEDSGVKILQRIWLWGGPRWPHLAWHPPTSHTAKNCTKLHCTVALLTLTFGEHRKHWTTYSRTTPYWILQNSILLFISTKVQQSALSSWQGSSIHRISNFLHFCNADCLNGAESFCIANCLNEAKSFQTCKLFLSSAWPHLLEPPSFSLELLELVFDLKSFKAQ